MKQAKAYIALVTCCVLWGVSYISTKICYQWFNAFSLSAFRYILAAFSLFIYALLVKASVRIAKKDLMKLCLVACTGSLFCSLLGNIGLQYISASLSSIIAGLLPVVTVITQKLIYKLPLTRLKIISVVVSVIGIILAVGFADSGSKSSFFMWMGILLSFGSVVAWAAANFLILPFYSKYSVPTVTFYQNAAIMMVCICFIPANPVKWHAVSAVGYANLILIGVVCSAVASVCYNFAIKEINLAACTIIINLMPVVTIISDVIILRSRITAVQIVGTVMIIASAILATGIKNVRQEDSSENQPKPDNAPEENDQGTAGPQRENQDLKTAEDPLNS